MVRRFSIPPLHRQLLSSPPRSVTPSNFLLCSHHRHSCLGRKGGGRKREGEGAVITWGSKTGCGQQRESSSGPLHSNPQSVLEQPRNSNSSAKQSSGIVQAAFTEKKRKNHMIGRRYSEGGQVCLAQKLRINKVVHKALLREGEKKTEKEIKNPLLGREGSKLVMCDGWAPSDYFLFAVTSQSHTSRTVELNAISNLLYFSIFPLQTMVSTEKH